MNHWLFLQRSEIGEQEEEGEEGEEDEKDVIIKVISA
jgi:hypothetical protein